MSEINPGVWDGLTPEQVALFASPPSKIQAHARPRLESIILTIGRGFPMTRMHTEHHGRRVTTIFVVRSYPPYLVIHIA
jgi:hypothetical protein